MKHVFSLLFCLLPVLLTSCASHCGCGDGFRDVKEADFAQPVMQFKAKASGHTYPVYRTEKARGAPILVLHELNGQGTPVLDFCLELETHGWTAYAPVLWGKFKQDDVRQSLKELEAAKGRWETHQRDSCGLVLDDMTELVRHISALHGGQRVVVMGNCLTGAFPLAMLAEKEVSSGILCQPGLPLPNSVPQGLWRTFIYHSQADKRALSLPAKRIENAYTALERDSSKRLLGFHYLEDWMAPMEKFERIHDDLAARGMESRFRPVILVPAGDSRNKSWWQKESTLVKRNLKGPHNTVTGSGSETDRRRMRDLMLKLLKQNS